MPATRPDYETGSEVLGQHRTKDRRREHQHEDYVEHAVVEQTLTCRAQCVMGDQRSSRRGGHQGPTMTPPSSGPTGRNVRPPMNPNFNRAGSSRHSSDCPECR
jgi:hypothetical protein